MGQGPRPGPRLHLHVGERGTGLAAFAGVGKDSDPRTSWARDLLATISRGFPPRSAPTPLNSVTFFPGSPRLAMNPWATGSADTAITIGIVAVACCTARIAVLPRATITSYWELDQRCRQGWQPAHIALGIPIFDEEVDVRRPAQRAETTRKRLALHRRRFRRWLRAQYANAEYLLRRLLRLSSARRGQETTGKEKEHPDRAPPHGALLLALGAPLHAHGRSLFFAPLAAGGAERPS